MAILHEGDNRGEKEIHIVNLDQDIQGGIEAGTGKTNLYFRCDEKGQTTLEGPFQIDTEKFNSIYWSIRKEIRHGVHLESIFHVNKSGNINTITIKSYPENLQSEND